MFKSFSTEFIKSRGLCQMGLRLSLSIQMWDHVIANMYRGCAWAGKGGQGKSREGCTLTPAKPNLVRACLGICQYSRLGAMRLVISDVSDLTCFNPYTYSSSTVGTLYNTTNDLSLCYFLFRVFINVFIFSSAENKPHDEIENVLLFRNLARIWTLML